ncbi:MAG: spondin domain-containing protein [Granulosicoccus sp.]
MPFMMKIPFANRHASCLLHNGLKVIALSFALVVSGCSDSDSDPDTESTDSQAPANADNPSDVSSDSATQASYRLTFNAIWSDSTHSLNFPGNPHFSGLVGAVHNEQIRFWEPAQIATPGIQRMAETGGKSTLLAEVQTAIDSGLALAEISGGGIARSPGTTAIEFTVSRDYPQITLTSMLAPSPDWFIGLHNYPLLVDGQFIESATIELPLYDSGSDNGAQYTSANDAADPLSPIATVSSDPLDSPFTDGTPSVGSFTLERLSVQ